MHVVPANANLRRAVLGVDPDDVIELRRFLVNIQAPSGESWNSSVSRTDTGDQSCEIMYVTELAAGATVYR